MTMKWIPPVAAAVVIALATPALASAAPSLTNEEGKLLPVGTSITGISTDMTTETSLGTFGCEETVIEGEVTENTGSSVAAVGVGEGSATGCSLEGSEEATVSNLYWKNLSIKKVGAGTITLTYETGTSILTCHFEGTVPFTYTTGDTINVNGSVTGKPFWCGNGTVNGTVTLQSAPLHPIYLH